MSPKLTVLFAPGSGTGAVKTCRSLAEELSRRGNRIVFAVDQKFSGQLEKYGFEEVLHSVPELDHPSEAELWRQFVWKSSEAMKGNPTEILDGFVLKKFERQLAENKALDKHYRSVIDDIKPDLIVVDGFVCSPALTNSGIPWIYLYSGAPLNLLNDLSLPPPFSGFQMKGGNNEKWKDFRQKFTEKLSQIWNDVNEWCLSVGAPELPADRLHPYSPYLNIYITPKELDYYSQETHLPRNWMRVECLPAEEDHMEKEFKVPEKFLKRGNQKLILVDLGTVGTDDVEMMRKLVFKLSHSEHKFIIVTGAHHGEYPLADNMWGVPSLSLAKALPYIDLVINSGSNYSVCEAFRSGKPMIVLDLYGDDMENAQRVREKCFGITLSPYTGSMAVLLASIDVLLRDPYLKRRANKASHRIRSNNDKQNLVNYIEGIVN